MAYIHLIEGPVGSGKSTYASELGKNHQAIRLTLDDWMTTLFSPDRPSAEIFEWYSERKNRCIKQIWKMACSIIDSGHDVILELGLIQQQSREQFFELVDSAGYQLKIYVLDAPREVRKERIQERNLTKCDTYSMEVPDHIFEIASDMWEPVDESECYRYDVKFVSTE